MKCNNCMMDSVECICSWKKTKYEIHGDIIKGTDGRIRIITPPYLVEVD